MIYSVNLLDLTEKVNPLLFAKYLRETGWNNIPRKNNNLRVYQIIAKEGELFQVTIPMDKTLLDYKMAMYEAVESVAFVEGRSTEQVMLFLLNPNTDILKIRLDRKDVEIGNIFFDDAIRIYENTKKLLAATAQDVLHPRQYHRGRIDDSILRFIGNCRFGQTEIGSYIVSVVCPFVELSETEGYQQLSIFSDEEKCAGSLTRLVTNRVMTNISKIKQNIDNGDEDKLVSTQEPAIISANFYEALAGLNLDIEGANVEFFAQWSPTVKKNRSENSHIVLSHDYYQPITSAIGKIHSRTNTKARILGRIKKLESSPDVASRTTGKVTVVYLDEDEKKKNITANLSKEDYDKAIQAHTTGSYIEMIGDITQCKSRNSTMICETFSIVE